MASKAIGYLRSGLQDSFCTAAIGRAKCYDADIIVNGLLDAIGIGEAASQQGKDTKQRKIDERKKHAS